MKIIFLDVDGLLNSSTYINKESYHINPEKVRFLRNIVDHSGANIVLTSTWKAGFDKKTGKKAEYYMILERSLEEYGLKIFDITEEIPVKNHKNLPVAFSLEEIANFELLYGIGRAAEAENWIKKYQPESFVILDDENCNWKNYGLEKSWIQTSYYGPHGGILPEHIKRAIQILNGKEYRNGEQRTERNTMC